MWLQCLLYIGAGAGSFTSLVVQIETTSLYFDLFLGECACKVYKVQLILVDL